jgi:hypothetical protein
MRKSAMPPRPAAIRAAHQTLRVAALMRIAPLIMIIAEPYPWANGTRGG